MDREVDSAVMLARKVSSTLSSCGVENTVVFTNEACKDDDISTKLLPATSCISYDPEIDYVEVGTYKLHGEPIRLALKDFYVVQVVDTSISSHLGEAQVVYHVSENRNYVPIFGKVKIE